MFKKILQSLSKSQAAKTPATPPSKSAEPPKASPALQRKAPAPASTAKRSSEQLCEISPKMTEDQVQARLKLLYRRYNRCASSLDPKIRSEADTMLDAIVRVREKYFGEI
jgi:hypothetical protein